MKNLVYQIDHLVDENGQKFWQFAGCVFIDGKCFEVDLTSNQPQVLDNEITVIDENGDLWKPDIQPFGYLDEYGNIEPCYKQ